MTMKRSKSLAKWYVLASTFHSNEQTKERVYENIIIHGSNVLSRGAEVRSEQQKAVTDIHYSLLTK